MSSRFERPCNYEVAMGAFPSRWRVPLRTRSNEFVAQRAAQHLWSFLQRRRVPSQHAWLCVVLSGILCVPICECDVAQNAAGARVEAARVLEMVARIRARESCRGDRNGLLDFARTAYGGPNGSPKTAILCSSAVGISFCLCCH